MSATWKDEPVRDYYVLDMGDIEIRLHRLMGIEGVWFVSCHDVRIQQKQLAATDVKAAKKEAFTFVKAAVDKMARQLAAVNP